MACSMNRLIVVSNRLPFALDSTGDELAGEIPNEPLAKATRDDSKGIPERLRAFGDALERYPEMHDRVVLIQVVVPSR